MDVLTASNLQKLDMQVPETPRTKVLRYFEQEESPLLPNRIDDPIVAYQDTDQWEVPAFFVSRILRFRDVVNVIEHHQSPILGGRVPPSPKASLRAYQKTTAEVVQPAFQSEDSEILAHNTTIQNRIKPESPGNRAQKGNVNSTYSWSPSPPPQPQKGIPFGSYVYLWIDSRNCVRTTASQEDDTRSDNREDKYESQTSEKVEKQDKNNE